MNYINHGVKFLFSIPLTCKHASCIAVALLEIFTVIGPPMILQWDNGNEFNTAAMTRNQVGEFCDELVGLTDLELSEVITEVRQLWPKCWMVRGSPHQSTYNGGVELVNRTMQGKLGAWMKNCKSRQWTIGCHLMMWQYNTQNHCTIHDIPYCLVFGQLPCIGISALPLDASVLTQLATEAQLNGVCNYVRKVNVLDNDTAVVEAIDDAEETETADNNKIQANINNSKINKYVAAVDNFNDINGSSAADDNYDEIAVKILQTMDEEENGAQVGNIDEENFPLAAVVMDEKPCTAKKSTPLEEIFHWHESVNKLPDDVQIDLVFLRELKLRESVTVAWCVENHEVQRLESFVPAFLTRISAHLWEITDEDNLEMSQLDWDGDEKLKI